ncbi:cytochrome c peroxidase [Steroidobacter flavus]|uniref:Cytochrome c peroxidase n=1 Tax=Steroidobacter flavus TaxID=1842136 RepID=A0ABV8T5P9_9GAMM
MLARYVGLASLLLLAACGGGGGSGNSNTQASNPPSNPPTGTSNRAPVVALENPTQIAIHRHAFSYDASQGGRTFSDPDGDALTYDIKLGHVYNPYNDPNPPRGLSIQGTRIFGAPEELEGVYVTITATDRHGLSTSHQFVIRVLPNSAPTVTNANEDRLIAVGGQVDLEGTRGGSAFRDPDGDPLTYEIQLRGASSALSIAGTRVFGGLDAVGLVEVTVIARDAYDGEARDVFLIAAPAPEPGVPTMPDPGYVYRDEALPLPSMFKPYPQSPTLALHDTSPPDNITSDAGATLGRVLFYDKRLSITNTHACGSCHSQARGFAGTQRFDTGALGIPLRRSSMALTNVRFNNSRNWFSDMRAHTLQEVVLTALQNPEELGSPLQVVEAKLRTTSFYPPLFTAAFGSADITSERIARALAQFLQSLISYQATIDAAVNPMEYGDTPDPSAVMTAQELRGLEIFQNVGNCTLCHEINRQINNWWANNGIDEVPLDPGTMDLALRRDGSIGVFRAASLKNVAVSAPYMHDGRFATLREVIEHYDHGVKDSRNLDGILRDVTFAPRRMNLSEQDKDALEALLRSFTDNHFLTDPKFSNPFL